MASVALAYKEDRKWTYADYKAWELKPGERFELIDGVAYAMSAPNTEHQLIASNLSGEIYNFLRGKTCRVIAAPFDVRLYYEEDESDDTVVQPDLVIVCDPKKLGHEGCRGAPDVVIEILSPSNTIFEMRRKLNLYREAGVKEYWIIDPDEKIIEIYRFAEKQYEPDVLHMGDTLQSNLFPGFALPLETIFAMSHTEAQRH